ncbi:MAG TPA: hypothetical protein VF624_04430 [Tepidisphaeraceae bacterium]
MMRRAGPLLIAVLWTARFAVAQESFDTVYAPPALPSEQDGINRGGVHLDFAVTYLTDYVFRGVEIFEVGGSEDRLNLQLDTKVSFDLGKLPHPFVNVFVNIAEDDPISDFQEIRPVVGFDWLIKPILFSFGHINYLYPDRDAQETSEIFVQIGLDENSLFRGRPVPTPYVFAAYDYDLYEGLYLEGGVRYRMPFEDLGLTLTAIGKVAYVNSYNAVITGETGLLLPGVFTNEDTEGDDVSGFQRFEIGLIGEYSLNRLFKVSTRYGDWSVAGYVFYTDSIENDIRVDTQIWGGAGLTFHY